MENRRQFRDMSETCTEIRYRVLVGNQRYDRIGRKLSLRSSDDVAGVQKRLTVSVVAI